jgi:hypothetical protein
MHRAPERLSRITNTVAAADFGVAAGNERVTAII